MHYKVRAGDIGAVDGVSFALEHGRSLGLVGESGCGKTSIAICLLRLLPENAQIKEGSIIFRRCGLGRLARRGDAHNTAGTASRWSFRRP